jgi:hypothetical protein
LRVGSSSAPVERIDDAGRRGPPRLHSAYALRTGEVDRRLGNRRTRLAEAPRHVLHLVERLQSLGFFERRQVLALDVLDECDLDNLVSSTSRMTIGISRRPTWTAAWYLFRAIDALSSGKIAHDLAR